MYTKHGNPTENKEVASMATVESNERWKKENTLFVGLRLMKKTDMDIIEALGDDLKKQPRVRELLRLGIEYEKLQREGTAPTPVAKTERPKLKKDYGFERTASGLPDLRKVKRWNQQENNEEEKEK